MYFCCMMAKQVHPAIELENEFGAHNYHPIPVVLERGQGVPVLPSYNKSTSNLFKGELLELDRRG